VEEMPRCSGPQHTPPRPPTLPPYTTLFRSIDIGLLEESVQCRACSDACRDALARARLARRQALAARERFRSRNARLARRERERRSEEHTSELQSQENIVCRLQLEKQKINQI